ncbi:MFS transporter [Trebonia kvetii]|uniref:MFS transporter n=1 Tax=Trebonia kvetii TaxID=2480626 RepID=A0A6P2BZM4_9ACTN|nr:MFS transporter [Trebonia kvetii]
MRLPRQVRILAAARAVNQLGAFSLAFLTVLLSRDLGASLGTAGAVAALFGLATIPSRLLGGHLADRLGRRRTILAGLAGCAAAQLGIAAAPDTAVAAGCAVLLGFAFELYEPPSQAMIADATRPDQRAPAYALLTTALAVGNMGAGLVAAAVGRSGLRWLFVVDAASCLGCALIVYLWLPADRLGSTPPARERHGDPGERPDSGASPWRDPALLAMTAAGTVFALVSMVMLVGLPLSAAANGLDPASVGLVTGTLTLVLGRPLLQSKPLTGLSHPAAAAAGFTLLGTGMAGYAVAHSLAALFAPTVAWAIGNLLLTGRAFAVVTALAPPGATARYLAVYGLSWGIATVAAPLLATRVIGSLGSAALWTASSALCLAMAAVQPWLLRAITGRRDAVVSRAPASSADAAVG